MRQGLRYAPEIRFFKDNTLEILKTYEDERQKYASQVEDQDRRTTDIMAGPLAHYARPLRDLLEYIKVFKKFSEG